MTGIELDTVHAKILGGYIRAMHWASTDFDDNSLEDYELSQEGHEAAVIACSRLLKAHGDDIHLLVDTHPHYTYSSVGHDLFLTRERHGAGFWDRELGHLGDVLTKYCEGIGECSPYVGDDNLIYMGE